MNMNNRQPNRRRGRNNNSSGGNNNNRPQQAGRGGFDSGNRIDSRARGNATQMIEKFKNMARDAQLAGDRVQTEYYLQFADHYFRVMSDFRARQDEGRPAGERGQDRPRGADIDNYDDFDGMSANSNDDNRDAGRDGGRDDGRDDDGNDGRDDGRDNVRDNQRQSQPRRDDNRPDRGDRNDNRGTRNDNRGERSDNRGGNAPRAEAVEARADSDSDSEAPRRAGPGPRRTPRADVRPAPRAASHDSGGEDIGADLAFLPPAIGRLADDPVVAADDAPVAKARPALKPRRPRKAADDGESTPAEAAE
jgi:hypothetical protein